MQKLFTAVLLVVLAVSPVVLAQGQGTVMMSLRQSDCPAMLVETNHGIEDLLQSAKLRNQGSQPITGYRIGWIAVYPTGKEKLGLGLRVELPLGIRPGATIDVPAQGVSGDYAKEAALSVVFFVTDVRTMSSDGTTSQNNWSLPLDKFEAQALALTKEQQALALRDSEKHSLPR
jgi:hypothetical protein